MRRAKPREPPPIAIAIFATVLLVIAARIGRTASFGDMLVRRHQGCDRNRCGMCVNETADNCPYGDPHLPEPGPQGRRENQHDGHHRRETEGRPDAESAPGFGVSGPLPA